MQHDHNNIDAAAKVIHAIKGEGGYNSDALLQLVYQELRLIAAAKVAGDRAAAMLDPTSLVHQAYIRLIGDEDLKWESRGHFFAAAAEAMRRILVERARAQAAKKRGGDWTRLALHSTTMELRGVGRADTIAVHDLVSTLEQEDRRLAEIVKLRFFSGLTIEQVGLALGLSSRTVNRQWLAARAWLLAELQGLQKDNDGNRK